MSSSSYNYNYNYNLLLLSLLLCILLHASHARPFGVINKNSNKLERKSQGSEQIGDVGSISSLETKSPLELINETELDCSILETDEQCKNKAKKPKADAKGARVLPMKDPNKRSVLSDDESLVSVSWRVPHKKSIKERHPGFSLDYSPPKTHPPSHN